MQIDGNCHCGYLSYEAEIDPETVVICHCADCQMLSGSAFSVVVPAKMGTFKFRSGEPKYYIKTADSGNRRKQAFCPHCATRLFSGPADDKVGFFGLRVGTIRQRDKLIPKEQIWCRSAQAWVDGIATIEPKSETE